MEHDERRPDPDVTPQAMPRPEDPTLHIREATTPPVYPDAPIPGPRTEPVVERTAVLPTQPVAPARAMAPLTPAIEPVYPERRYVREERAAWPYVLALVALLAGGLGGYLIGAALDDDDDPDVVAPVGSVPDGADVNETLDMLLARTQADGEYRTPSEYPQLDQITEIDTAAATAELENQIAVLTAAQDEAGGASEQVVALETALADVTAERDELAAELAETGGTDTESQAQLEAANEQIAALEDELTTARDELEAANAAVETAQADLAAATEQLEQLEVVAAPNYVNGDVARARSDAAANGWTLIEQTTESGAAPGTVLEQAPPANSNMIRGSVLVVSVAGNV